MRLFLKDSRGFILLYSMNFIGLAFIYNALDGFEEGMGYFVFLSLFLLGVTLAYRYISNRQYYSKLSKQPEKLEDMLLFNPHSELEQAFNRTTQMYMKLHSSEINSLKNVQKEYKVMLNQWVHHMKTPLSVINLIAQNNEENEGFKKVLEETEKLNYDLSQILLFLRLEDFKTDMKIQNVVLRGCILEIVNELKTFFIINNVFPKVEIPDDLNINTDKKWIKVAIYQIINNAIKYSTKGKKIYIKAWQEDGKAVLSITNEGIGIKKADIKRIFDLSFTGENGRSYGESSGIGLYITKKIINLLGHKIAVESQPSEQTTFYIYF